VLENSYLPARGGMIAFEKMLIERPCADSCDQPDHLEDV